MGSVFTITSIIELNDTHNYNLWVFKCPSLTDDPDETVLPIKKAGNTVYYLDTTNGGPNYSVIGSTPYDSTVPAAVTAYLVGKGPGQGTNVSTETNYGDDTFRSKELDRCVRTWEQVSEALTNIVLAILQTTTKWERAWYDAVPDGWTGTWNSTKGKYYCSRTTITETAVGIPVGLALHGLYDDGAGGLESRPISDVGSFEVNVAADSGATMKLLITGFVRDYLRTRDHAAPPLAYEWVIYPTAYREFIDSDPPTDGETLMDRMIKVYKLTTKDTISWETLDAINVPTGYIEAKRIEFGGTGIGGGWVRWAMDAWNLPAYSRVPRGFPAVRD